MGCFADHAGEYGGAGLRVFPVDLADKRPCLTGWRKAATTRPGNLALRFPDAGIGIANDSGLTVVDVDDAKDLNWSLETFGDTPVKVQTPGGFHLWYKASGEKRRIRPVKGRAVDLLGRDGFTVAPPSQRPDGAAWRFLEGGLEDLVRLPVLRPDVLPEAGKSAVDGQRNNILFRESLRAARSCATPADLLAAARRFNAGLDDPLPDSEVERVAVSAWGYQERGDNWCGLEARAQITNSELEDLGGNGDAVLLLMRLRAAHGLRERFALALAFAESLGWTVPRFRAARSALQKRNYIECLHAGGRGRNDPPIYQLKRGTKSYTNITDTPSPPENRGNP